MQSFYMLLSAYFIMVLFQPEKLIAIIIIANN